MKSGEFKRRLSHKNWEYWLRGDGVRDYVVAYSKGKWGIDVVDHNAAMRTRAYYDEDPCWMMETPLFDSFIQAVAWIKKYGGRLL